jgi:hypothetical protein
MGSLQQVRAEHPEVFLEGGDGADDQVLGDGVEIAQGRLGVAHDRDGCGDPLGGEFHGLAVGDEGVGDGRNGGGLGGFGLAAGGVAEGDDAFGQFVGDGAGVLDKGVEELVDTNDCRLAVYALQIHMPAEVKYLMNVSQ